MSQFFCARTLPVTSLPVSLDLTGHTPGTAVGVPTTSIVIEPMAVNCVWSKDSTISFDVPACAAVCPRMNTRFSVESGTAIPELTIRANYGAVGWLNRLSAVGIDQTCAAVAGSIPHKMLASNVRQKCEAEHTTIEPYARVAAELFLNLPAKRPPPGE